MNGNPSKDYQYDQWELPSKYINNGWKWMSFPVLDRYTNIYDRDVLVYDGNMTEFIFLDILIYGSHSNLEQIQWISLNKGETLQQYVYNCFEIWTNLDHLFTSPQGYKIRMVGRESMNLPVSGFLEDPTTPIQIWADQENWVGYFLEESRRPLEAFPEEVLNRLTSITAQHWYLKKINGVWSSHSTDGRFDYGGMYILETDADLTFQWEYPSETTAPFVYEPADNFEYEELAEYTPVLIDTIETNEPVTEVGVFIGDDCVGAEKVTEYPVHLRVYNGTEPIDDMSFVIVQEGGSGRVIHGEETVLIRETADVVYSDIEEADNHKPIYRVRLKAGDMRQVTTLPTDYALHGNYPNPFNPTTTISFDLPKAGHVRISIYNIKGRMIDEVVDQRMPIGSHTVQWDASDYASGVYFVRMMSDEFLDIRKMMLIK